MKRIKVGTKQLNDMRKFALSYGKHLIYGNASTLLTRLYMEMTPRTSTPNPMQEALLDKIQELQKKSIYESDQEGKKAKDFASEILDWPINNGKPRTD
jgi:hypothetical protein